MTFISNLSPWPPLLPAPPYAINWGLKVVTPPAVEPVTTTMLKNHARIEVGDDDWSVIPRFIRAARRQVERDTNRFLVTQTWDLTLDAFPLRSIPILVPRPPLQSLVSITTVNSDGTTTVDTTLTNYLVDTISEPGRIGLIDTVIWPQSLRNFNPITVRFVAGYTGIARGGGIASMTWAAGTVTVTTNNAHGLGTGENVTIAGVGPSGYNGTVGVTVTGATTFTYALASNPGLVTVQGTVSDLGVPDEALEAILLLAAHFYENREASIVSDRRITVEEMPIGYSELVGYLHIPYVG